MREAPLYVLAFEVALWLEQHGQSARERSDDISGAAAWQRMADHGRELLFAVADALTFRAGRARELHRADRAALRLRVEARLAVTLGVVQPRQHAWLIERVDAIGRMLGGWKKRSLREVPRESRSQATS